MKLQNDLANTANSTQTALSKLGKPISFDLQNAIASELGSESTADTGDQEGSSSDDQNNSNNSNQGGQDQQGNSGQNQGNSSSGQNGQGQGNGQGNGSQGQGNGQGSGSGNGNGGSGAGKGQGSRDLLSIPERIGGSSETTADGGPLGGGTAVGEQKGAVPITKGTIQPYEEVIGQYKDSYLESSDRMQLPKDLQDIVQSYFSSIESE